MPKRNQTVSEEFENTWFALAKEWEHVVWGQHLPSKIFSPWEHWLGENGCKTSLDATQRNVCCEEKAGAKHTAYVIWIFRSIVALTCSQMHYTLEHTFVPIPGLSLAF